MEEMKKENGFKKFFKALGKKLLEGLKIFASMFKKDFKKDPNAGMLEWKKDGWKGALCLAPILIVLAIFTFYPIIKTFIVSFFPDYDYVSGEFGRFSLDCYQKVLTDDLFWRGLKNTVIMLLVSVPLSIIIALLISVLLNSIKKLQGFFQTIFFLPYVTNGIAFGMVFATIFSPMEYGLVNSVLDAFGIGPIAWTGTANPIPFWAGLLVIVVYTVWNSLAFKILVFLGGLQGIDKQYYQAAQIDETPKWRVFTKITVPLLSPMILYITITSLIGAFKSYSSIVGLFGESMGANKEVDYLFITVVGYIYEYFKYTTEAGQAYGLPIASAAALILFIIIMIVTFFQMLYNKKKVHY